MKFLVLAATLLGLLVHLPLAFADDANPGVRGLKKGEDGDDVSADQANSCCVTRSSTLGGAQCARSFGFTAELRRSYCEDFLGGGALNAVYLGNSAGSCIIGTNCRLSPVANNDNALTFVGESVVIDVLDNDEDPDGGFLRIISFGTTSAGGEVYITPPDSFLYIPASSATADYVDTFTYTIENNSGLDDTATVTIEVKVPSSAPSVSSEPSVSSKPSAAPSSVPSVSVSPTTPVPSASPSSSPTELSAAPSSVPSVSVSPTAPVPSASPSSSPTKFCTKNDSGLYPTGKLLILRTHNSNKVGGADADAAEIIVEDTNKNNNNKNNNSGSSLPHPVSCHQYLVKNLPKKNGILKTRCDQEGIYDHGKYDTGMKVRDICICECEGV